MSDNQQGVMFGDAVVEVAKPWQTSSIAPERIEGIQRVDETAVPSWKDAFDAEVERLATARTAFTVYDVLDVVGQPEGVHPSAIGARMRANATKGIVKKHGVAARTHHGDYVTEWIGEER